MIADGHRVDIAHRADSLNLSCPACYQTWEVLVATGQIDEFRAPGTDDERPPEVDPLAPARGCVTGTLFALVLWVAIFGGLALAIAWAARR